MCSVACLGCALCIAHQEQVPADQEFYYFLPIPAPSPAFSCLSRASASSGDDLMDCFPSSLSDGGGAPPLFHLPALGSGGCSPRSVVPEVQMLQQHQLGSQLSGDGSLLDTVLTAMWDESMAEGLFRCACAVF